MLALATWCLACFAAASALSVLDLGEPLRRRLAPWPALYALIATPSVVGAGVGLLASAVGLGPSGTIWLDALVAAGGTRLLHLLVVRGWSARPREGG